MGGNMKKLICLLGHPKRIMKFNELTSELFENDNRAITVYDCKYCGKHIFTRTRSYNAKVKEELCFDKQPIEEEEDSCEGKSNL